MAIVAPKIGANLGALMKLFITGTDTNVGKTYVASLLVKALAERGESVMPLKPVVCGERTDAQELWAAAGRDDLELEAINPVWLKAPQAPFAAAMIENRELSLSDLVAHCQKFEDQAEHLIVEGAGGWEVPLTATESLADLAHQLGYPVVVVVDNKLGALNHTILTVRRIEEQGLTCAGLVLNSVREERDAASISNRVILEQCLPEAPILAELLHEQSEIDPEPFLEAIQ